MLLPLLHVFNSQKIILASSSPRRKELLQSIGIPFSVVPSLAEENVDKSKFPQPDAYALETARVKTMEVVERLSKQQPLPDVIIGADTIVAVDSDIIGKPKDEQDAVNILTKLSGKTHSVHTGVIIVQFNKHGQQQDPPATTIHSFSETTHVTMATLSDELIRSYVATREPFDKAGGYGIQGVAGSFIEGIQGDYYNVTGFPLHRFCKEMAALYQNHQSS